MPDIGLSSDWIRDQFMKITEICGKIVAKQEEQDRRMEKVEEKLDELSSKPGKRWDGLVTALLGAVVAAIVAGFIATPK